MAEMTQDELRQVVAARMQANLGYHAGSLPRDRQKAMRYYRGEPFGTEIEGKSKVVSRDVAEVVDTMMPSLMRIFAGSRAATFEPVGEEDQAQAEQATDYLNHVWMVQNPGFKVYHDWIKDGLLARAGVVKIWWDTTKRATREHYEGLTAEQLDAILADEGSTAISVEEVDRPTGMVFNADIRKVTTGGRICVANVPPDEFVVDLVATTLDSDTAFCAHRFRATKSRLRAMGFDEKLIEQVPWGNTSSLSDADDERRSRFRPEAAGIVEDSPADDDAMREVWVAECYLRVDADADGYAEMRKVFVAGDNNDVILEDEEVDDNPFAAWTPYPIPHKFYGESVADKIMDVQEINSALLRQGLDNLYLVNNPRKEVEQDNANLDDAMSQQLGGILRVKKLGGVREIETAAVYQHALKGMEFMNGVRESRTGVTRYNQGLDADTLNKTATGVNAIMNAANMRQELVARIFAEMGVKRGFRLMLRLANRYQDQPRVMRLRNKYVQVDPRSWNADMDVSVAVGLGSANKDQKLIHIGQILGFQKEILAMQQGPGALVGMNHVRNALSQYVEAADMPSVDHFFGNPEEQQQAPQEPKPDPAAMEAQAKAQAKIVEAETNAKLRQAEAQQQAAIRDAEAQQAMAQKEQQFQLDQALKAQAAARDLALKEQQAMHGAAMAEDQALRDADAGERRFAEETRTKARAAGVEGRIAELTGEAEEEGDDMDARIMEHLAQMAQVNAQQAAQTSAALEQMARGLASVGDGMRALAEQMGRPKRVVADAEGNIVGVEPA